MKKAYLLSTVAAALLLTAGAASAQDMKKETAPSPAPAAQQSAPAEKSRAEHEGRRQERRNAQAGRDHRSGAESVGCRQERC
ncbi:MAG: hypothetical protein WDN48_13675 [Pseudolabrys sp.]